MPLGLLPIMPASFIFAAGHGEEEVSCEIARRYAISLRAPPDVAAIGRSIYFIFSATIGHASPSKSRLSGRLLATPHPPLILPLCHHARMT